MRPTLFYLLILLCSISCKKDINVEEVIIENPEEPIDTNPEEWEQPVENITGSLSGFIIDEYLEPIPDAVVKLNGTEVQTDIYGHFQYENIIMNRKGTFLTVEKEGYFLGSRRFFPEADRRNYVKVQLAELGDPASALSNQETEVITNGNASLIFPPNSIVSEDGTLYNGEYSVYAKWLDPSLPTTFSQMPGNLQGVNSEEELQSLKTLGMMQVEIYDGVGNELNLAEGQEAVLSLPVPQELLSLAPDEIPMWSFDEERGVWQEEGTGTLENGFYTGKVSHFSTWNFDIPVAAVEISFVLQFPDGTPAEDVEIYLTTEDFGVFSGVSCEDGSITGLIPANEVVEIHVLNICSEEVLSLSIGPYSVDTDLGSIIMDLPSDYWLNISGTLVDCDENPVSEPLLALNFDGLTSYHFLESSDFDFSFLTCNDTDEITLSAINLDSLTTSDTLTLITGESNDLDTLILCDNVFQEGTITIKVHSDFGEVEFTYIGAEISSDSDGIDILYEQGDAIIAFGFEGNEVGDYSGIDEAYCFAMLDPEAPLYFGLQVSEFHHFEVTSYGDSIVGSWSAGIPESPASYWCTSLLCPVECTFTVYPD